MCSLSVLSRIAEVLSSWSPIVASPVDLDCVVYLRSLIHHVATMYVDVMNFFRFKRIDFLPHRIDACAKKKKTLHLWYLKSFYALLQYDTIMICFTTIIYARQTINNSILMHNPMKFVHTQN